MTKAREIADFAPTVDILASLPAANDTVTLPSIRKRLRGIPDLLDFGSVSDMGAAMLAATNAGVAEGWRKVLVPAGTWQQPTAPAAIAYGMLFEGEDRSTTVINVNHTGSAFYFTGQFGGGGGAKNMFIQIGGATNAFAAVRADASASGYAPDGLDLDMLWITYQSTGRWSYGIWLDGSARNPGSGLQGIRNCKVSRITTFGTTSSGIYMRNNKATHLSDVLINGVGGTSEIALLGITSAAEDLSNGCTFEGVVCGALLINNTIGLNGNILAQGGFNAGAGISNSALQTPPAYHALGSSSPPITGLTLVA